MLVDAGYTVIPVNPKYKEVNGLPCYEDFSDVPLDIEIDIVNVFRNSAESVGAVHSVVERAAKTGRKPVIWTQLGVSSREAELAAAEAEFEYVRNVCIMVELERMSMLDQSA